MMNIPILSSRFFKDHKPTPALYQKWREIYSWTHQCIPIYEWEDVLFVGCLQIPKNFPESVHETKVVFVLCEPLVLKSCWQEFEGTVPAIVLTPRLPASAAPSEVAAEASAATLPSPVKALVSPPPAESPEVPPVELAAFEPMEQEDAKIERPDSDHAISLDALTKTKSRIDDDDPSSILVSEETPDEDSEPAAESASESETEAVVDDDETRTAAESAPEGLIFNPKIETPQFDADALKTMTSIKLNRAEPKAEEVSPMAEEQEVEAAPISKTPAKEAPVAPVSAPKKATPTKTEMIYTKPGALSSNRDLGEKQELTRSAVSISHSATSSSIKAPTKMVEVINNVFSQMTYHYQKTMILLAENEDARPWKWSENFRPSSTMHTISFATPNPFRVVARTQKSYHGYVVPNESNDKFFEEWDDSVTPDHLTISPILIEEDLVGFLVGFGDKSADNKNSLMLCEKLANDLAQQIKRDPQALKAA